MTAGIAPATLSVRGLSFRYPHQDESALADVSFDADSGQTLGVLGPNGSGKSTLLASMLNARQGSRSGDVLVCGKPPSPTAVGYVAQQIALYRQLTVLENMRHAARARMPRRDAAAAVELAMLEYGLEKVADTLVLRLSGGWQRIVHIAASLVHRPPIRLLDEPTVALDFDARARLITLVQSWRAQQVITLVTSHYPEDIEQLCSSVLLLEGGRIVSKLKLSELLSVQHPMLVLESEVTGRRRRTTAPAPAAVGDLPEAVAALLRGEDDQSAAVADIRITRQTLRELLSRDYDERERADVRG
jgi:ABC-2 type transport system ATP-binding protein